LQVLRANCAALEGKMAEVLRQLKGLKQNNVFYLLFPCPLPPFQLFQPKLLAFR
jgi:hypothetical protein